MAIIKHYAVKGKSYGAAIDYCAYLHDEYTGEMIRDGRGNPVPRDSFLLDGINCEPLSFPTECREVNNCFHKNQKRGEILYHHFIVSFDPKDATERGLSPEKALKLSKEWAERSMPGHQVLVCIHTDGHHEAGNIHAHLYVNSVRKYDAEPEAYGERPIDHKAGYKLHMSNGYLKYMKSELMTICERENLHQVDLLGKAERRVTDREYYAKQHGQYKLDELNEQLCKDDVLPIKSTFQTNKDMIRDAIDCAIKKSKDFEEFTSNLSQEYHIAVRETRGRLSYRIEDHDKYISERSLGTAFGKEEVLNRINIAVEKQRFEIVKTELSWYPTTDNECREVFTMRTSIKLVVRLQDCAKAQDNSAYADKVRLTNLKTMAETILFIQENGIHSTESLKAKMNHLEEMSYKAFADSNATKHSLKLCNEGIHYVGQYYANKKFYDNAKANDDPDYAKKYHDQIEKFKEAKQYVDKHFGKSLPTLQDLKTKRDSLIEKQNRIEERRNFLGKQRRQLNIAQKNINYMFDSLRELQERQKLERQIELTRQNRSYDMGR